MNISIFLLIKAKVESIYEKLISTKFEEEEIKIFCEVIDRGTNYLMLKIFSIRHFNRKAFKQMMRKIWRLVKLVKFHEPRLGLFLKEFVDINDKEHVLRNDPWNFDKSLVLIKDFDGSQQIRHVSITKVFDLPMMARNKLMGKQIGDSLGKLVKVDIIDGKVSWNEVMRICIKLDVTKPLARSKRVKIGDGTVVWVRLAYKRLPKFCYYCGIIGHCCCDCNKWISVKDQLNEDHLSYGQWLQAQPYGIKNGNPKQQI